MDNFLKREFDEFLSFYRSKNVEIDLNPPPLALEQLEELGEFKTKNIGKLGKFIISNIELSKNNDLVQSESIQKLQPVKISYKNIEMRMRRQCVRQYEFRLTSILKDLPKIPYRDFPRATRSISNYLSIEELYVPIMDFNYLQKHKESRGTFQMISLKEPSITRKSFWIDLFMVPMNPISPLIVKEIQFNEIIFLPMYKSLEGLKEISFEPINKIEFVSETTESHPNDFEKKCVVNSDALMNDVLIEILQSRNWKIYERNDVFNGLQVIQVCKDRVIVLIQITNVQSKLNILKQYKNLAIILEIKDQK